MKTKTTDEGRKEALKQARVAIKQAQEEVGREDREHAIKAFRLRMGTVSEPTERDIELELQNIYFMSDLAEELYRDDIKKRKITQQEAQEHVESFTSDKREQGIMLWSLKHIYKMTVYAKESI